MVVRPLAEGRYEIISGHRRAQICRELGVKSIPAVVKELSDMEAVIAMVDANLQRESLLPSEKAFAFKMKLEAVKKQRQRSDRISSQLAKKLRSDEMIAKEWGIGKDTLHRYIRLTQLIPELLDKVYQKQIALTPAVELSYLPENEQRTLAEEIQYAEATPSFSQAQRLRNFSRQGCLPTDIIFAVPNEEKPNQREQLRLPAEDIRKYFPKGYTHADMQKTIIRLLKK